jgi:hypothetical protein
VVLRVCCTWGLCCRTREASQGCQGRMDRIRGARRRSRIKSAAPIRRPISRLTPAPAPTHSPGILSFSLVYLLANYPPAARFPPPPPRPRTQAHYGRREPLSTLASYRLIGVSLNNFEHRSQRIPPHVSAYPLSTSARLAAWSLVHTSLRQIHECRKRTGTRTSDLKAAGRSSANSVAHRDLLRGASSRLDPKEDQSFSFDIGTTCWR